MRNFYPASPAVKERLSRIQTLTHDEPLKRMLRRLDRSNDITLDEISNCLMAIFRDHRLVEAYTLLYELNHRTFLVVIFNKLKYYCHLLDPRDILQDVFLSIYRYPSRFQEDKPHAFRNWSYSIIRNTILKHLRMREHTNISTDALIEVLEDHRQRSPLHNLVSKEGMKNFGKLYYLYLILYLNIVNNYLTERERKALHLVEVEDKRYREASHILGIKLENFKMVVCRARKKILRHMNRMLGEDAP